MTHVEVLEIAMALADEKTVYDKTERNVYMSDNTDEGHWYGLICFVLNTPPEEIEEVVKKYGGMTTYCTGCLPASGCCRSKDGYSMSLGFEDANDDEKMGNLLHQLVDFVLAEFGKRERSEIEIRED